MVEVLHGIPASLSFDTTTSRGFFQSRRPWLRHTKQARSHRERSSNVTFNVGFSAARARARKLREGTRSSIIGYALLDRDRGLFSRNDRLLLFLLLLEHVHRVALVIHAFLLNSTPLYWQATVYVYTRVYTLLYRCYRFEPSTRVPGCPSNTRNSTPCYSSYGTSIRVIRSCIYTLVSRARRTKRERNICVRLIFQKELKRTRIARKENIVDLGWCSLSARTVLHRSVFATFASERVKGPNVSVNTTLEPICR